LVFITEVQSVYSAVRTESLYYTDTFRPLKFKFNATDTYGAVEAQLQEFLSWAVGPDEQIYNPVALGTEE
jgi:hypothetical protein